MKKKIIVIICILIVLIITIGFSIPFIKYIEEPDNLRRLLDSYGALAPLAFITLVIIQILIPYIPGEPFELLAGYMFGSFKGTILCLVSGSIASCIIILLVRKYGEKILNVFFNSKEHNKIKFLRQKKYFFLFAILFIIPGTPKDLLCYVAGLSDYDLIPLIIVTSIGRIPSIVTSTITSDAISNENYLFAIIVYGSTILISSICLIVYNKITQNRK